MLAPTEEKYYRDFLTVLNQKWQPAKAAFYALDAASSSFVLKAQFGFTRLDHLAVRHARNDVLVNYIYDHREPTYFNGVSQATGKLADLMMQSTSTHMLLAPLYLDGRVMGIVDAREKAGRQPFSEEDVLEISDLLRRFAIELRRVVDARGGSGATAGRPGMIERPVEWLASVAAPPPPPPRRLSEATAAKLGASGVFRRPAAPPKEPEPEVFPSGVTRVMRLVEETLARSPAPKLAAPAPGGLSKREAEVIALYLPTCLSYQEVEVAAVSSFVPGGGTVAIAARRPLDPDLAPALLENLEKIFSKSAVPFAFTPSPSWRPIDTPRADAPAVRRAEISSIQSSVLDSSAQGVVLFSLLFRHGPTPEAREALRGAHVFLRSVLAGTRSEARYSESYRGLVNKLLEPGLQKRTALKTHSFNVGRMARNLAARLGVSPTEVEQITVAGLLHDVGMRELNYEFIYTKRTLTDEEMALVRQHPRVGAFLVEDIPWPYPVAPLIRHHHERWDGGGYPDGLKGDRIPFGARIIHLCEAFDALTSPTSYRAVLSDYQALDILGSKAGTQFDPELTPELKRMIENVPG